MNIAQLIGETSQYDKKERLEIKKPKSWLKSVSAFANTLGGWLIWGITDDNCVIGVDNIKLDSEKISELIKDKMDPIPQIDLQIKLIRGKNLILLHVFQGTETPYYYTSDGMHIAYIRVGNQTIPAKANDLKRLVLNGERKTFDSMASHYSFADCTFEKLQSVYRQRTGQRWQKSDYQSFGLLMDNGMLTNAGALLADGNLVRYSRVFCTRWNGLDKAGGMIEAWDDRELIGSLLDLLQGSLEFVKANTKTRWMKLPSYRVNMPEYPERAVQEAITNALIHRDYLVLGSEVHIDIFDDRMEIYSPGGMYDGTNVQDLPKDEVVSLRRNPVIADIFNRMDLMERRGSGFRKIREDYRNAVLYRTNVEPKFYSNQSSFFVTLWNLNYGITEEKIQHVKDALMQNSKVSIEHPKVSIEPQKVSIDPKKVSIEVHDRPFAHILLNMKVQEKTRKNIRILHEEYGTNGIFGRNDMVKLLSISSVASAGKLLSKMKAAKLVEKVSGHGKGKYRFTV